MYIDDEIIRIISEAWEQICTLEGHDATETRQLCYAQIKEFIEKEADWWTHRIMYIIECKDRWDLF